MTCAVAVLQSGKVALERREDLLQRAEPRICAFDIETTKLPLQFPNSEHDQVQRPSHLSTEQSFISSALCFLVASHVSSRLSPQGRIAGTAQAGLIANAHQTRALLS